MIARIPPLDPRGVLLWDGKCGFCARWAGRFERLSRKPVGVRPVREVWEMLPEPARAAAAEEVLWVEPDGAIFGGGEAIARALSRAGRPLLGFCFRNPFARAAYRWVARNRGRFSGGR